MRHLGSFLFGLVLAPVIWFLAALGQYRLTEALPTGDGPGGPLMPLTLGALLMAAGGVWLGLLLGSRISPVGPGIAGLLWLALGAAFILDIDVVINALPDGPTGQPNLYELPLRNGYAFLVGVGLLVPLFSPQRWRKNVLDEADDDPRYVPMPAPEPVRHIDVDSMSDLADRTNDRLGPNDRLAANNRRSAVGRAASPTGEVPRPDFSTDAPRSPRQWNDGSRTPWDR